MLLLAVMLFYYGFLGADSSFWVLLPALVIGGIGMAMTMTPVTAAAMSAVAVDKAGVGSAVLNSARQVGGSLGIAVMGAIVASTTSSSLRQGETRQIAFLHGFHDALRVGSFLLLAGAAIAVLAIRKIDHPHHEHATLAEPA
jgi:DHA2 family methylenomycin A resistance protein-like MFS transporter